MKRICHICGQPYEYPSNDPNVVVGLRRCSKCINLKRNQVVWRCTCGETFNSRAKFYDHRRAKKLEGNPCKDYIYDEPTGECPFCGQPIGMSKNKLETHRDCLVNHRCEGVIEAEKLGITLRYAVEHLQKVKRNNSIKNTLISVDDDKFLQLGWVQSLFERHNINGNVFLQDSWTFVDQLVICPQLKCVFIFDDQISERSRNLYTSLRWTVIELKWTDCILKTEEMEQFVIDKIKS